MRIKRFQHHYAMSVCSVLLSLSWSFCRSVSLNIYWLGVGLFLNIYLSMPFSSVYLSVCLSAVLSAFVFRSLHLIFPVFRSLYCSPSKFQGFEFTKVLVLFWSAILFHLFRFLFSSTVMISFRDLAICCFTKVAVFLLSRHKVPPEMMVSWSHPRLSYQTYG